MKKSKILRKFLTTVSLCGTLCTNSNAIGATIPNLGSVSLSTGAGLVGGVFNNGDIGNIGSLAAVNILLGLATLNSTILKAANINLQSNTSVLNVPIGDEKSLRLKAKGRYNEVTLATNL
ncbi:hypothetical protein [Candidatus Rickettsia kedanie]|uniref:Uncharacterized protein n=1 Tax=Candidatus Rickettsia kedanie TaxID=3115352 RepID=A0ABP9TWQ6_9RICK